MNFFSVLLYDNNCTIRARAIDTSKNRADLRLQSTERDHHAALPTMRTVILMIPLVAIDATLSASRLDAGESIALRSAGNGGAGFIHQRQSEALGAGGALRDRERSADALCKTSVDAGLITICRDVSSSVKKDRWSFQRWDNAPEQEEVAVSEENWAFKACAF